MVRCFRCGGLGHWEIQCATPENYDPRFDESGTKLSPQQARDYDIWQPQECSNPSIQEILSRMSKTEMKTLYKHLKREIRKETNHEFSGVLPTTSIVKEKSIGTIITLDTTDNSNAPPLI